MKLFRKKSIGTIIVVSIFCAFFLQTTNVSAAIGLDTADLLSVPIKSYTDAAQKFAHTGISAFGIPVPFTSLDSIMKMAVKKIIEQMQKEIINWVNNKNPITGLSLNMNINGGGPLYVQNLDNFMNQIGNKAGAQYLNQLSSQNQLCNYFKDDLTSALRIEFNISDDSSSGFGSIAALNNPNNACNIENQIGEDKLNTFINGDFTNGGGWDSWTALTQKDANNPMGAYLTQKEQLALQIQKEQQNALEEARWSDGMLPVKDADGNTVTPGSVVSSQLNFALTSDMRQLEGAKTFDDIVTVLVNSLINKTISNVGGLAGLNPDSNSGNSGGKYLRPSYSQAGGGETAANPQPTNVAPQGTAFQGSTMNGSIPHDASMALTGSYNRNPDYGVSITKATTNPWWYVDLGDTKVIDRVYVVPPYGNDYLLTNFYICVSEKKPEYALKTGILSGSGILPGTGASTYICSDLQDPSTNNTGYTFDAKNFSGRYVSVQMKGANVQLAIAGVQVFTHSIPVLTLIGSKTVTIGQGSYFEDQGASAIDENDGDISDNVVVSGSVNTAAVGTYTLTYTVKNSSGISAPAVTRTVIVQ